MTAEQPKIPAAPTADDGTVDPDHLYTDGTPAGSTDTAPTVKPDHLYTDGTKE